MEAEPPDSLPEPTISVAALWLLRLLALACAVLILLGIRQSGALVAIAYSLPYLLGAWWLRPGTLRRGLGIIILTAASVGLLAFFSLAGALAIPPDYFDQSPEERRVKVTALTALLLSQTVLLIIAARAYFRTRPRPPV